MNYHETVDFLYSALPMYQRQGKTAFKKDLTNIKALCHELGEPQNQFKTVHIAGTNGKGSCSHMLASILQTEGFKTGLYTSPHLKSFTERIKIDGKTIEKDVVVEFVERIRPLIDRIKPSFFEITVAMAFYHFATEKVDFAVIEVGLGGRLDSTNIISPELSVITNIGYDHMDLLGDTLAKIAAEKAGIIKKKTPVVIGRRHPETDPVFIEKGLKMGSRVHFVDTVEESFQKIALSDNGVVWPRYLHENAETVVNVVSVLRGLGISIGDDAIRNGLKYFTEVTGFRGRWQYLSQSPVTICDTAHNIDGIREVMTELHHLKYDRLFIVWGMVDDKDRSKIFSELPLKAEYIFCQPKISRMLEAKKLAKEAKLCGLRGEVIEDVNAALETARQRAESDDLIYIGGSTFVVAELEEL